MTKKLAVTLVVTLMTANFALGGTLYMGANTFDVKTPVTDLKHDELGMPLATEGDFCEIIDTSATFNDELGNAINQTYSVDLAGIVGAAGPVIVTDVGWDVNIAPVGGSWYSEATFSLTTDTDPTLQQPITLAPGAGDDFGGDGVPMNYSSGGPVNLNGVGLDNLVAIDGTLNIELFETFVDNAGSPDTDLLPGSSLTFGILDPLMLETHNVTVKWVPEPASFSLLGFAMLLAVQLRRRKSH